MIGKERNLTMSMPVFLGVIRVKPTTNFDSSMYRDDEAEKCGMTIALKHEIEAGRRPEDVSKDNLGFDIRSIDGEGIVRYIEVKARASIGAVALTKNEWFKAQRLRQDYYLYVIWNAKSEPNSKLLIIKDPSENLNIHEKVESVRYIIAPDELNEKAISK